jgi:hypothetical protein
MPGFSAQIAINAAPAVIFAFVSRIANMPRFLPTLEKATRTGDRVRLKGAANGRRYVVEGNLSVDDGALLMSWGSLDPQRYHGELQVFDADEGAELACRIEFEPQLESVAAVAGAGGADADFVTATLDEILHAVKQAVECQAAGSQGTGSQAAGSRTPTKPVLEPAGKGGYKLVI